MQGGQHRGHWKRLGLLAPVWTQTPAQPHTSCVTAGKPLTTCISVCFPLQIWLPRSTDPS